MVVDGFIEARCVDCDLSLGWQHGTELDPEIWHHNNCPVRTARTLGISDHAYETLAAEIARIVKGYYPDLPVADGNGEKIREFRANIATHAVLAAMAEMGHALGVDLKKAIGDSGDVDSTTL